MMAIFFSPIKGIAIFVEIGGTKGSYRNVIRKRSLALSRERIRKSLGNVGELDNEGNILNTGDGII